MPRFAFLFVLAALVAGCGGSSPDADREPPPPPPPLPVGPPPAPAAPDEEAGGGAGRQAVRIGEPGARESALLVVNQAGSPIRTVYVSPCTEADWGPDLLAGTPAIAPGATLSFALQGGCWDLRAVRADATETIRRTAQIQSSTWRWEVR